jgi:Ca2+-binding EF-hand superfamily protein
MPRILLMVWVVVFCGPIGAAHAQANAPDSAMRWFDGIDVDKDDVMTLEEMTRVSEKRFPRTDADGDGRLTEDEYLFGIPADRLDEIEPAKRRFSVMDRDGDGFATREEYLAFGARILEIADQDGDGRVTREEFAVSVAGE